ncbi:hypothetical protein Ndes2437A_g02897 [Nannochloris sp. 'desiccata']
MNQPRTRHSGACHLKRTSITVNAFMSTKQDTVKLPIDFYSLLQINPGVSRESVSRAYERALNNPPDVGYSSQALSARSTVLQGALETLAAAAVRREYDERFRMGEISEEVPVEYVAGTLMLLQESGDRQTVVAVGEAWLAQHKRHKSTKDVVLATALAHIDVAKAILDARGSVESAHATLEVAARLLKSYRAGTAELVSQIESAASDLRPQLTLDLLSSENATARARGLAFLPDALEAVTNTIDSISEAEAVAAGSTSASASRRRSQFTRPQYLERLREVLTADQQIALYNQVGNLYAASPAEICNLAIAHIAAGVASAKPFIIRRATELLADAEQIAAAEEERAVSEDSSSQSMIRNRRIVDEKHRRAVAACAAWLLLGNSAAAGDALGLRDGRIKCDRQVMHFIRSNSPEPDSLLPGVCALVQRWVSDVALASFRTEGTEILAGHFILDDWFENPKVLKELDDAEGKVAGGFLSVLTAPLKALAGIFLAPKTTTKETVAAGETAPAVESVSAKEEEQYSPTPALVPATAVASTSVIRKEEKRQEEKRIPAAGVTPPPDPVTLPPRAGVLAPESPLEEALAAFEDHRDAVLQAEEVEAAAEFEDENEEDEFLAQPVALESIKPLYGEDDWMRKAYETRTIRWNRVAGAAAVVAATSLLAARSYLGPLFSYSTSTSAPFPTSFAATSNPAGTKALSHSEATSLISKWHKTKAAALGSSHSLSGLSSVLSGDLLKQWQDRAAALQAKGWHYTHTLHSSKIEDVVPGPAPGTAIITAAFKEGVTVHKGCEDGGTPSNGDRQQQTFISEYKVVYQTIKQGDAWMLVSAVVQQTP